MRFILSFTVLAGMAVTTAQHDSSKCVKHADRGEDAEFGSCCGLPGEITCSDGHFLRDPVPDVCGGDCPINWCNHRGILANVRSYECVPALPPFIYRGCYVNHRPNRVGGHVTWPTWEQCRARAQLAGATIFGMEYPQGAKRNGYSPGHAQCLILQDEEQYLGMDRVSDEECEAEGVFQGKRLGGAYRLAVYRLDEYLDGDLNIRFNKMAHSQPMTAAQYPLTQDMAETLRETNSVSVIHPADCRNCVEGMEQMILDLPGGPPTHPSRNPNGEFWEELRDVIYRQFDRAFEVLPTEFMPLPKLWQTFDIHQVADAVHDEFPGIHHSALLAQFIGEGATMNRDALPADSKKDFIRGPVSLSALNGWAVSTVSPTNFGAKWMFGRARPEEVAWKIKSGEIGAADGVPQDIINMLNALPNFNSATEFTAYPEGSPVHPSWPAMHSAASVGSMWIATVMNLTPEQFCEAKKMDYAIAYARTVAGVHYPTDNTSGLNLGQEILARELPGYLSRTYGADEEAVRSRIASLRFDWRQFAVNGC